jgi:hypothetical protein
MKENTCYDASRDLLAQGILRSPDVVYKEHPFMHGGRRIYWMKPQLLLKLLQETQADWERCEQRRKKWHIDFRRVPELASGTEIAFLDRLRSSAVKTCAGNPPAYYCPDEIEVNFIQFHAQCPHGR